MRNQAEWRETKFVRDGRGRWRASRRDVPITSWLVADLASKAYAEAIESHVSGRLADLGCGLVPLYAMYREKITDVVCIDWPGSLHGSAHVDIFADLNAPLDLAPASFDTVIATDVVEHLHSPQALFASAERMLKPGGKLIVGVPFLYWIHEAPHDYHRYTRFALEKLAHDAGLAVISIVPYAGAPEVLSDIATKAARRFPFVTRCLYWVTRLFLALPPVKMFSTASRETMPMGYVLVTQKPFVDGPEARSSRQSSDR
jgi:SAM-dependent methyltransferase